MAIEILRRRPVAELQPSKTALRLIASFEGLSLKAYRDSVGIATCGYGHTGNDVYDGMQITLAQADAWLQEDIEEAASIVRNSVRVPLTQGEFDALTSITFNIGRVPRSMLACLNGGTTDRGVVMSPGSYGSCLLQFPRNCRAAGVPLRGLYRRRLSEACVFSDLPYENACSIGVVHLEVDAAKNIVPSGTTSLEDTLMKARQDLPILRPDASDILKAPWPKAIDQAIERAPTDAIPVQLPIPGEDELVLTEKAAAPIATEANEAAPEKPPSPAPGRASPDTISVSGSSAPEKAGRVDPLPPSPPPVLPSPLPPPPKPVVIAPKSIDIRSIPYGEVDPANGAKNMTDSTRFIGMLIVGGGSLVQVLAAREVVSSTAGAIFFDLSRDPVIVALIAGGVIWVVGSLTRWWGKKVITKGMVNAKEVLK